MNKIKFQNDKSLTAAYLYDSFSEKVEFMQKQIFSLLEKYESQQKIINLMSHQQDQLQTENQQLKDKLNHVYFNSENYKNYDHQIMAFEKQMQQVLQNQQQLFYDTDKQFQTIQANYIKQFEQQLHKIKNQHMQIDDVNLNIFKDNIEDLVYTQQMNLNQEIKKIKAENTLSQNKFKKQIHTITQNFNDLNNLQLKIKKRQKSSSVRSNKYKSDALTISRKSSPKKIIKSKKSPFKNHIRVFSTRK